MKPQHKAAVQVEQPMERELTRVIRRIAAALHSKQFPNITKFTDDELKFGGWWALAQVAYQELLAIDAERVA